MTAKLLNGKTSQASLRAAFSSLEAQCPERVDFVRWHEAVADGKAFLREWGERAEAGWNVRKMIARETTSSKTP